MLKTLDIKNFTCFPEAKLEFSPGLNVIVGENGTGKSHLLKLGYAALYAASQANPTDGQDDKTVRVRSVLNGIFKSSSINKLFSFYNTSFPTECCVTIKSFSSELSFGFNFDKQIIDNATNAFEYVNFDSKSNQILPIFIPAKEILSIYKNFASELRRKFLQFDDTYLHLADALGAAALRGHATQTQQEWIQMVQAITNTDTEYLNDEFYIVPFSFDHTKNQFTQYPRVESHLAAEGVRKIGILTHLLKNDSLKKGSSLFWDEPEANLNPKLIKKLAEVLVELSSIMQLTIATHSLFLVRELEILQENQQFQNARYFGLHFNEDGNGVRVTQGDSPNHIGDIVALDEEVAQSSRYLSMGE